jgi:hypothetical protein
MIDEVYTVFLNGMPLKTFIGLFSMGLIGALLFYLGKIYKALNPKMPKLKISLREVIRAVIKLILSLSSLAICIVYFKEISPVLFNIAETEHEHVVDINGKSAILLGLGIDRLWSKLLSLSEGGAKLIKRQ